MVSISTYRDERKLFAVIGTVIVAASIALVQLEAARAGRPSLITDTVSTAAVAFQSGVSAAVNGVRSFGRAIADAPRLYGENAQLRETNANLSAENARLREALVEAPDAAAIAALAAREPAGISATAIGYDPEGQSRMITLDKGTNAGIAREDGVIDPAGAVGRVVEADPFMSKVLLVTDPASKVPAVVQRGRWWGIATGTNSRIEIQFVSQDAKLRVGDVVVTGEGRAFHAGIVLGRIARVDRVEGALYQSALVEPAVAFGRLHRVLVLSRS